MTTLEIILLLLLIIQATGLLLMYLKSLTLTKQSTEQLSNYHEQFEQLNKLSDHYRQKSDDADVQLRLVNEQNQALHKEVDSLNQKLTELRSDNTHSVEASLVDNRAASELDHNVGIMLGLWGDHISQVVMHQEGKGAQIASMLDTVVDDVKLVASDLNVTSHVNRLVAHVYESRGALHQLLQEQQLGADAKRHSIQEMDTSIQQINRVEEIVQVMYKLTFTTQLLASNAAVAAARASGEEGRAFKVIAVGMAEFAQEISASAREISHVVADFKQSFSCNLDKTREQIHSDLLLHEQHTQQVNEVMDSLVESVAKAENAGSQLAGALVTLESDVAAAVRNIMVDFQYQDRVKQILDHVVSSLKGVAALLETGQRLDLESWLKEEMRSYTTQEERDIYCRKLAELGFSIEESEEDEHILDNGEMMFF